MFEFLLLQAKMIDERALKSTQIDFELPLWVCWAKNHWNRNGGMEATAAAAQRPSTTSSTLSSILYRYRKNWWNPLFSSDVSKWARSMNAAAAATIRPPDKNKCIQPIFPESQEVCFWRCNWFVEDECAVTICVAALYSWLLVQRSQSYRWVNFSKRIELSFSHLWKFHELLLE